MSPSPPQVYLDVREDGLAAETSHPAFVAVAPEWFYDQGDPRTPFGNDDGYDALRDLEEWYGSGGDDEHAPGRVAALLEDWGLVPEAVWDRDSAGVRTWLEQDESHVRFMHGEVNARIAGALGQFKIIGWIHPALRFWAEQGLAMAGLLNEWETRTFGVEPDDVGRDRRAVVANILEVAPEPPGSAN